MEEAPTITEEFEEVKKVEKNEPQKTNTQKNLGDEEKQKVTRVSFSPLPLDSPIEKSSLSVSNDFIGDKSSSSVNWDSQELDDMATGLQAGYKGMKVREEQKVKDEEEVKVANIKNKEIEERLDIDLEDPDVVKATTKIQAGFRGAMTRKSMKKDKEEGVKDKGEEEETRDEDEEGSEDEEGESDSEYEDSEEEEEVGKGKNTFVLLKQLVGIMKLGAGPKMTAAIQKEAEEIKNENRDNLENGSGASEEVINGGISLPKNQAEEEKGDEVNGDVRLVGNGNQE